MKKIAFWGILFLFLCQNLNAQDYFRFGFQLSPTITWLSNDDRDINGNGSNLGLKLGVMGERFFNEEETYALTFGLGLTFNQGGTLKHNVGGSYWTKSLDQTDNLYNVVDGANLKYGIQYVEIPLGLKMRTAEFGYLRYFVEPNFVFGFKTQAKGSISSNGADNGDGITIKKDVNFLNAAWGLNVGVEYAVGENTSIVGGLGYQNGFTDVTDNSGQKEVQGQEPVKEDSKAALRGLVIKLGVMF